MVTIKEAELLTGITRQNIRYYEKMGLIYPSREKENQYRKYNKDDIRRLKLIYMFRKLDMPLEEIQQILDGRKDLQEALEQQKEQLRQKQQKLAAALSFCGEIQETELTDLNVDLYLQKMEAEEKQGNKFADILDDYKKVVESESIRTFSFLRMIFVHTQTDDRAAVPYAQRIILIWSSQRKAYARNLQSMEKNTMRIVFVGA